MSDHPKNNGSSGDQPGEFDRNLALTSRAYKNAEVDLPSAAMDDAIRAAARRAVKSQPHAVNKSWISRWSIPISAAALVVLSVSVGLISLDEQPDLAPASLREVASPKAVTAPVPESAAPVAVIASNSPQPTRTAEKKARLDFQSVAPRDQLAASAKPDLEQRRNEADGAASGNLLAKDADRGVASPAAAPFVPAPPPAEVAKRQESDSKNAAETTKREAPQVKQLLAQTASAAVAARGDVGSPALQKSVAAAAPVAAPKPPIAAGNAAIAPPVYAAAAAPPSLGDKANEPPDVWMKRILELKRLERTREFEDELARFRKRYPDFAMPEELKVPR